MYSPYWALWCERVGTAAGVIFIIAALIFGSITEQSIWSAPAGSYVTALLMLTVGSAAGYVLGWMFKFPRRQSRTIALETGIQNSTLTIAILTLSFPVTDGNEESKQLQEEILQFPLLYSVFLIVDSVVLTAIFYYVSEWDPEEEKVEAKRLQQEQQDDYEREMNDGKTLAEIEAEKEGGGEHGENKGAGEGEDGPAEGRVGGAGSAAAEAKGGEGDSTVSNNNAGAVAPEAKTGEESTAIAKSQSGIAATSENQVVAEV